MRLYSWNVNGFRAVVQKGFWDWFTSSQGDVVCLQETKATLDQVPKMHQQVSGYELLWNGARVKKGYSGVACLSRATPLDWSTGLDDPRYQGEGRTLLLEFRDFYLFNIYYPNGQMSQERLDYKLGFYGAFLDYAERLRKHKPIVVCGDFNTAHKEIDLKNPKANSERSGFLPQERAWIDEFIAHGYLDTFRMFNSEGGHYSWWTYRFNARANNAGWRIDYFFVSAELRDKVRQAWIEDWVYGSDHCPVGLELDAS
jgi:exodeoxyribonuclease-3